MAAAATISQVDARACLWGSGELEWKLYPHQYDLYNSFRKSNHRKFVFLCSRRLGKSFVLLTLAFEEGMRRPGTQIRFAAPTQKNVREIILPNAALILDDCPPQLKPKWKGQDCYFEFPNGSRMSIAGTDQGNADRLRGSACDLAIVDEAGFVDDLRYVVRSILMPQLLTTGGRLLISSTPPKTPGHQFTFFAEEAEAAGAIVTKTIYDDSRQEVLDRIPEWIIESGGEDSTDWKREYLCQFVTDATLAIIPEMTVDRTKRIVREWQRPDYYDSYVAMDVGFNDLTAVLFAYWDFAKATLVIEDEIALSKMRTDKLAEAIKAKEQELWLYKKPLIRVSDTDLIVINDLNAIHDLGFIPTAKDDKEAAVNAVRMLIAQDKVIIHPRCKGLIAHLKFGVWNKQRSQFERTEGFGHFDFVDALVYLVRNLRRDLNPYPTLLGMSDYTHYIPEEMKNSTHQGLERAFNGAWTR